VAIAEVRIVPQVDERSRTFQLVGKVYNENGVLASGLSVVGWVPSGQRASYLVVPVDAIMRNEMGPYVYVARQLGEGPPQAMPANVEVLFEIPGRVVIAAGGVQAGDRVVVEGNERLFPTAPLAPTGEGAPGGRAAGSEGETPVSPGAGAEDRGEG
jgi:multidrug efflux system membrane fusion protein